MTIVLLIVVQIVLEQLFYENKRDVLRSTLADVRVCSRWPSLSLSLTYLRNIVHIDKKFTAVQRTGYELEYSIVLNMYRTLTEHFNFNFLTVWQWIKGTQMN